MDVPPPKRFADGHSFVSTGNLSETDLLPEEVLENCSKFVLSDVNYTDLIQIGMLIGSLADKHVLMSKTSHNVYIYDKDCCTLQRVFDNVSELYGAVTVPYDRHQKILVSTETAESTTDEYDRLKKDFDLKYKKLTTDMIRQYNDH